MSGVPNAMQVGPSPQHTNARYQELVSLVTRIDEIERRLEDIENVTNRHWFKLATYLTSDMQHGNRKGKPNTYICPCCHEFIELMPEHLIITKVNAVDRRKRQARKDESTSSIP